MLSSLVVWYSMHACLPQSLSETFTVIAMQKCELNYTCQQLYAQELQQVDYSLCRPPQHKPL